jgi:adenine-specific DNA methylase
VICAALWIDPADPLCPEEFRKAATKIMRKFWDPMGLQTRDFDDPLELRRALLDFIADFANWDNSTKKEYLDASRALTQAAHEALGGIPGTKPLVVDPFAGGGAIPLEALRVGADAFASDLNPVAVLLNKVVLEYIPRYGRQLADEVRKWGEWVKQEAEKELAEFYPKDPDGATPIAYLWARTITCEGPGCGAEVPLMRSLWLAKKKNRSVALRIVPKPDGKRVDFEIIEDVRAQDVAEETVRRGSVTCPCCGFTTPVKSVRQQLKARRGGAADARLFCVVTTRPGQRGRFYRLPTERDLEAVRKAAEELERRKAVHDGAMSLVPDEPLPPHGTLGFRVQLYGMEQWGDLFAQRQALALATLVRLVREAGEKLAAEHENGMAAAVQNSISLVVDRMADGNSSLSRWQSTGQKISNTFGRQALPMIWDYCEANPFCDATRSLDSMFNWIAMVGDHEKVNVESAQVGPASATAHPLPDDTAQCFFTDPPYYDAVPYADLSDFFIVWLKRTIGNHYTDLFSTGLAPKDDECIVDEIKGKDKAYFEATMGQAMSEGRRILAPDGVGVVVFAHKSTAGWEAQLQAMVDAGWTVTGSWPIDTEMGSRLRAMNSAALASSIHLVCRPRETHDGIGEWRDVLHELPGRIHEWMPRLVEENIVGADAIFSCLGPAMEIFSRYSRVEKASGEQVMLKEYMEYVWAAVTNEALNTIFAGADATGFEEDARLTAMWLWTLSANANGNGNGSTQADANASNKTSGAGGFALEYDAARKIAQGLGAHLESLPHLVEIKKGKARLLPVEERRQYLFGKDESLVPRDSKKEKTKQAALFGEPADAEEETDIGGDPKMHPAIGTTVLDRIHQAMLLFGDGRSDALKRFLVEDGVGLDGRFWRLAGPLHRLYPKGTSEERWIDGVLGKKKVWGL